MTPRWTVLSLAARVPRFEGFPGSSRVRSGLIVSQVAPPSAVFQSTCDAKKRTRGSACEKTAGAVRPNRAFAPRSATRAGSLAGGGQSAPVHHAGGRGSRGAVAVSLAADRRNLAERDPPIVASAGPRRRPALLLPAVDAVGEAVVRRDVEELRGRLV